MPQTARTSLASLSHATTRFVDHLEQITDLNSLSPAMQQITVELGFGFFILGQLPSTDHHAPNFYITNYPDDWRQAVYSRLLFGEDPVIDALTDAIIPFLWEDTRGFQNPTPRQREYIEASFSFGFSCGYTVPIKAPGEPIGVVSFATKNNTPVNRDALPFAAHVATNAYRRAMRLVAITRAQVRPQIALTDQEVDCLKLMARGLSSYVAARRLSLSTTDYNDLVRSMFSKLGYANRVTASIRGLELGLITYNDALMG